MKQVEARDKMHVGLFVCAMKLVETRAIRVPIEALVAGTALETSLALECSDRRILGVFLGSPEREAMRASIAVKELNN